MDYRKNHPRFQGENLSKNLQLLRRIENIARRKNCSAVQLVLAWVLAQGNDIVQIPGTKNRKYLEENVTSVDIKLDAAELEEIDRAMPRGIASGARYPEGGMKTINR